MGLAEQFMVGTTEGGVSFDGRVTGIEVQLPEKQHAKRTAAENKELTT